MLFSSGRVEQRALAADELLYSEGQPADTAYLILSGRVGLTRTVEDRVLHVGTIAAGALVGEGEMLSQTRRAATAIALEPTTLMVLKRSMFIDRLAEADPVIRDYVTALADSLQAEREQHMVKPRSLLDAITVIRDLASQMKLYAMRSELVIDGPQFVSMLGLLETAISRLEPLVVRQRDRRGGVIPQGAHIR